MAGNEAAANAIEVLCYGIAKYVGGYVAAMNGVLSSFLYNLTHNLNSVHVDTCFC